VRDAQGNALAVYDNAGGASNWKEQMLYGSSRLGIYTSNIVVPAETVSPYGEVANFILGKRFYELSNHLGNVLATVTDKRIWADGLPTPDIASAQDYYTFGML